VRVSEKDKLTLRGSAVASHLRVRSKLPSS
jgi:hypothetical protein